MNHLPLIDQDVYWVTPF